MTEDNNVVGAALKVVPVQLEGKMGQPTGSGDAFQQQCAYINVYIRLLHAAKTAVFYPCVCRVSGLNRSCEERVECLHTAGDNLWHWMGPAHESTTGNRIVAHTLHKVEEAHC